jgi:hypothetical protein
MYNVELLSYEDGTFNQTVEDICSEYGIKGELKVINNELYIVAGLEEVPKNIYHTINRNRQCEDIFYTGDFAVKVDNQMKALQELIDYCFKAEFVKTTWTEFQVPVPDKVTVRELHSLINCNSGRHNPEFDVAIQTDYALGMQKYFEAEKRGGLFAKWRDFYRSERYDYDASLFKNIINFITRKKQTISEDKLRVMSDETKKIEMQEKHFKEFKDYMKTLYPNIPYAVGKKTVIDHGQIDDKNGTLDNPWKDVPSYWEFRDIYIRKADEPIIAEAFNSARLSYATNLSKYDIEQRGPIEVAAIPINDFFNFASLAKQNNLPFTIDKGEYAQPSLDMVYIIYNTYNKRLLDSICRRTLYDAINFSHSITPTQIEYVNSLQDKLDKAKSKQNKK